MSTDEDSLKDFSSPSPPKKPTKSRSKKTEEEDSSSQPKSRKRAASTDSEKDVKEKVKQPKKKKTVEEEYQKLNPREHVLLRPDMYIGSIRRVEQEVWLYDEKEKGMILKKISFVPGLYKIFDEILVNAADNFQRDPKQTTIKVTIDPENKQIIVYNDGNSIPVVIHEDQKKYVPEMVFGELLTGSNFDDEEEKVTGGRNGLGAKLTNIYSTEFIVETADGPNSKKKFKQIFTENMTNKTEPLISNAKVGESYVQISFKPDLKRFDMTELEEDMVALLKKRVYDIAGCNSALKVYLNGTLIKMKDFTAYVKLYLASFPDLQKNIVYETIKDSEGRKRWEVAITLSEGEAQQVSFVNSICTMFGGSHVAHVQQKLTNHLKPIIEKKMKNTEVKPLFIKNNLWLFVNSLINNPEFDSQTKERLKSSITTFTTRCELSDETLKKVEKIGLIDRIMKYAQMKANLTLTRVVPSKKQKRITGYEQLVDANNAGSKHSKGCTLILTEGASAKALAVAGMTVIGRDNFGVFPLKGKPLNVRDATETKILQNEEIQAIMQIVGLKPGVEYTDTDSLRYGHIMIMADQDVDGSHIKGLLINFIQHYWPSLFKIPGFLTQFITPIVKVSKRDNVISFYSIPEYEEWKLKPSSNGWHTKYYKGLGTSTSEEAREYFGQMAKHKKDFEYTGKVDDEAIEMAFSKAAKSSKKDSSANIRKDWINSYKLGTYLDQNKKRVSYYDFIYKELVLFSIEDCSRSIPSLVDGLKPGQRKILFACFKRKLTKEIRVAQLAGYVSEVAAYHHGEVSLQGAIVGMAQNFVGSNNINILHPQGQFGTRLEGGKDASSARYIHTYLSGLARIVFHVSDDGLLEYLDDDGLSIEPKWYIPIIPLCLVNGQSGIGTGYSSTTPSYNPRDLVENIQRLLRGKSMKSMMPWYRGFLGTISKKSANNTKSFQNLGKWHRIDDVTLEITELPVAVWTVAYKKFLEDLLGETDASKVRAKSKATKGKAAKAKPKSKTKKEKEKEIEKKTKPAIITDYKDYNTDTRVRFVITCPTLKKMTDDQVVKTFKLEKNITFSNMHMFDADGKIKLYSTAEDVVQEFFNLRLEYYKKRKEYLVNQLNNEWKKLKNKVRFILAVIAEELIVRNRKKKELTKELLDQGYDRFPDAIKINKKKKREKEKLEDEEDEQDEESEKKKSKDFDMDTLDKDYDYLLSMPIWSLTLERVELLKKKLEEKREELDALLLRTSEELWEEDLEVFLEIWNEFEQGMADFENNVNKKGKKKPKMPSISAAAARGRARAKTLKKDRDTKEMSDSEEKTEEKKKSLDSENNTLKSESEVENNEKTKKLGPAEVSDAAAPAGRGRGRGRGRAPRGGRAASTTTGRGKKRTMIDDYYSPNKQQRTETKKNVRSAPKKIELSESEEESKSTSPKKIDPKKKNSKKDSEKKSQKKKSDSDSSDSSSDSVFELEDSEKKNKKKSSSSSDEDSKSEISEKKSQNKKIEETSEISEKKSQNKKMEDSTTEISEKKPQNKKMEDSTEISEKKEKGEEKKSKIQKVDDSDDAGSSSDESSKEKPKKEISKKKEKEEASKGRPVRKARVVRKAPAKLLDDLSSSESSSEGYSP